MSKTALKPKQPPAVARRSRRSTGEVLARMISAAIMEFEAKGYSGARTAAIARRAGVAEPLLFKHFGSKENLFQRAIFEQLDRHFTRFAEEHGFDESDPSSRKRESRAYIDAQQDFLRMRARMFRSLFASEDYSESGDGVAPMPDGLQDHIDKMVGIVESRGGRADDGKTKLTARVSFATVLACALFRDWLFPPGIAAEEDIRTAVTDFVMEGAKAVV